MLDRAPREARSEASLAARREQMLSGLLLEVRARRRRRKAARAVGILAVLGVFGVVVGVVLPAWRPLVPRPAEPGGNVAQEAPRDLAPVVVVDAKPPERPRPQVASRPRESRPLIVTVGTSQGLVERWASAPTRVNVVMVNDEQLLASLNESGHHYGLMRVGDAATLVPRRER